jgi:hypothetical protein
MNTEERSNQEWGKEEEKEKWRTALWNIGNKIQLSVKSL